MKSKLGMALSWVLVFLLGAVAGAAGQYLYKAHSQAAVSSKATTKAGVILERLANMLQLDAQQKESLKLIFAASKHKYQALGEQYRPQWEAIRDETNEQIKQILRPDQKAKFEAFLKKVIAPPPSSHQTAEKSQ